MEKGGPHALLYAVLSLQSRRLSATPGLQPARLLCPWDSPGKNTGVRILDSVGEGEGGMFGENSIETCILSRVKQITSPGWMHETSARGWCTGKTQRDRVEREAGGGIGMGNTCKSMADSCQCMAKTTTIL